MTLFFSYNLDKLDRYFFEIYNFTNLSLLNYIGMWKTGIIVFVDNFGVGRSAVNFAFNNVEGSTSDAIKNDNFYGVFF